MQCCARPHTGEIKRHNKSKFSVDMKGDGQGGTASHLESLQRFTQLQEFRGEDQMKIVIQCSEGKTTSGENLGKPL